VKVERAAAKLVGKGWKVERIEHVDEVDEPVPHGGGPLGQRGVGRGLEDLSPKEEHPR
jgi:hypothetical protein